MKQAKPQLIFRYHRGSLDESMKTEMVFSGPTLEDAVEKMLKEIMRHYLPLLPTPFDEVVISDNSTEDRRIGWHDVHYVCISGPEYDPPQCIGMCATDWEGK